MNGRKLIPCMLLALLVASLAPSAHAATHTDKYSVPCSTLWLAVQDTLKNSSKYAVLVSDNINMTASYSVGGGMSSKVTDTVNLSASGSNCTMSVQAPFRGWANNDAGDFKKRVDAALGNVQATPEAATTSAPTTAATTVPATSATAVVATPASGPGVPPNATASVAPAQYSDKYAMTCAALWPSVRAAVKSQQFVTVLSIDDANLKASYKFVSLLFRHTVDIALNATDGQCEVQLNASKKSMAQDDGNYLKKRIQQVMANAGAVSPTGVTAANDDANSAAAQSSFGDAPSDSANAVIASSGGPLHLYLVLAANCPKDPDPFGIVSNNFYSKCKPDEMNTLRSQISDELTAKHVIVEPSTANGAYQAMVTITQDMDDRNHGLAALSDFASGTLKFAATYQITDASGQSIASNTVTQQGSDSHPKDIEKQFAYKIGDALAGLGPASTTSPATDAASPIQTTAMQQLDQAAQANDYHILAHAYQSLPIKPLVPDIARAQKRAGDDAMKTNNAAAAEKDYESALRAAIWWPDAMRALSLSLAQINNKAEAIVWMQRYLEFVPNADDALVMQAKVADWSKVAAPTPLPTILQEPKGSRLGASFTDTPSIVALSIGQPDLEGAMLSYVFTGSIADRAGLQVGDILVSFNDAPITNARDLFVDCATAPQGSSAELEVWRSQNKITAKIHFDSLPMAAK